MGNTAVAVLHFDMWHETNKIDPRLGEAMIAIAEGKDRRRGDTDFGRGRVISWDHADGYQVCVVHGNTGWRLTHDREFPDACMKAIISQLEWRGYKVIPPKDQPSSK